MSIKILYFVSRNYNSTTKILPIIKKVKSAISITAIAANRLSNIISECNEEIKVEGVRIGINKRGCNGLSYTMNYIHDTLEDKKKVEKDEIIICDNNVKVFIESKAIFNIVGTTLDYIETDMASEFSFINPNSKGSCGCGESFTT